MVSPLAKNVRINRAKIAVMDLHDPGSNVQFCRRQPVVRRLEGVELRTPIIPLPRDFQDFLRLLNANAIRYVMIDGYAVAYHGYVR